MLMLISVVLILQIIIKMVGLFSRLLIECWRPIAQNYKLYKMKKLTAALVICCFLFLKVKSQTGKNEILLNILKGQKAYLNNNIKENEKPKYLSLLYFASVI